MAGYFQVINLRDLQLLVAVPVVELMNSSPLPPCSTVSNKDAAAIKIDFDSQGSISDWKWRYTYYCRVT